MKNNIQIVLGSPLEYEELVAYLWIDGKEIALVHKEEGGAKMKVQLLDVSTNIYLDVFIEALQEAKIELLK